MTTTLQIANQRATILVPVVTLEEMPQLTNAERDRLRAEFDQIEAEMKAGNFILYSPEWLRGLFKEAFETSTP